MIVILIILSGCGAIGGAMGFPSALIQLFEGIGIATTVFDGAAVLTNNKTLNDRILSKITNEDCKTIRLFQGQKICVKKEIITKMTLDTEWKKKRIEALKFGKPIRQRKILMFERSTGTLTIILPPDHEH